jgi:hypothetical protein
MSRRFLILMALSLVGLLPVAGQRKGKTSAKTPAKTATKTTVKKTAAEVNTTTVEALLEDYRFTEAARLLERDLQQAARTAQPTTQLEERLRRARLGADMLRGTEKVTFVDSVVVPKKNFLRAYRLSRSQGTLAPLAELIPAWAQRASGEVAYRNEWGDRVLFAAPDSAGRRKLFATDRLGNTWSTPTLLKGLCADDDVADYPFLMPDGVTLYFAAQGEESLGGYDIFVTRYNRDSGTFLRAENVGMPFNSPANDYLMAIDEATGVGWFVSDRRRSADSVCVYTFLPSASRDVYELSSDNEALVRRRARLSSVAESQEGAGEAVAAARQRLAALAASGGTSAASVSRYVISDNTVYTSLSQFRSAEARRCAAQADSRRQQWEALQQQLEPLRTAYAATPSRTVGAQIQQLEQQSDSLREQWVAAERAMRRAERQQ